MFKSLIFLLLRAALGYFVISMIFVVVTSQNLFPGDAYTASPQTLYHWFFFGTIVAWVAAVILSVGHFAGFSSKKSAPWLAWAPLWLPPIYALGSGLWLWQTLSVATP